MLRRHSQQAFLGEKTHTQKAYLTGCRVQMRQTQLKKQPQRRGGRTTMFMSKHDGRSPRPACLLSFQLFLYIHIDWTLPRPTNSEHKDGHHQATRKLEPKSGFLNLKSHLPKLNSPIICWQHLFFLHTFATGPLLWCSTRHTPVPKPTMQGCAPWSSPSLS